MSDFDAIVEKINENQGPYSPPVMPKVKGKPGARLLTWTVEGVDTEYIDASMMIDEITDEYGIAVQEDTLIEDIGPDDDSVSNLHQIMVGNLDLIDSECWALFVECDVMYDANFESNANFKLIEGKRQINAFLALHQDGVIKETAQNIVESIAYAAKGKPELLLRLRELMRQGGGEEVFRVWDAEANANALESQTPAASGQSKRLRV